MTYDPKKDLNAEVEMVYPDMGRIPNVIVMQVANKETHVEPIPKAPSAISSILNVGKLIALILAGLASSIIAAQASGLALPSWLLSAATVILAIAAPLGIGSSGIAAKADSAQK